MKASLRLPFAILLILSISSFMRARTNVSSFSDIRNLENQDATSANATVTYNSSIFPPTNKSAHKSLRIQSTENPHHQIPTIQSDAPAAKNASTNNTSSTTTTENNTTHKSAHKSLLRIQAASPQSPIITLQTDAATTENNASTNNTSTTTTRNNTNATQVMIRMMHGRGDRLGSYLERPLGLMGYARCHGYDFCIHKLDNITKYFDFPLCPPDLEQRLPLVGELFVHPVNTSGTYDHGYGDQSWYDGQRLLPWLEQNAECAFGEEAFRLKWWQMILNASRRGNATLAQQSFFHKKQQPPASTSDPPDENTSNNSSSVATVAVHIRRGDYEDFGRKVMWDETYVVLIRKLRRILERAGKTPEVHVFSEDYGFIHPYKQEDGPRPLNWSLYDDVVDYLHLAPDMRKPAAHLSAGASRRKRQRANVMDVSLNLRDWRHFVEADVLVIGSTFSKTPALARPKPAATTGLPLTLFPCTLPEEKCRTMNSKAKFVYNIQGGPHAEYLNFTNLPAALAQWDY